MVDMELTERPKGCCGAVHNTLQWYEIIHWVLFLLGVEMAVSISILYWSLFYDPSQPTKLLTHINVVVHMVNGIVAMCDLWISRTPVRIYHVFYLMAVGFIYVSFTGIYYAAGGGNDYNNGTYIYPQLDYGNHPATSSALSVGSALVYIPLIHLIFYCNYLLREGLLYLVYKCNMKRNYTVMNPPLETESNGSSNDEEPLVGIV